MKYRKLWSLFILSLTLSAIYGQSVRASIESAEVYIGQPFEYKIIIEGSTDKTVPELPQIENIQTRYTGASTTLVSSFGTGGNSSSRTITHSWIFTPLKSGKIFIPSVAVKIDGKVYNTSSGVVLVKEPEPVEGFHLILESEKKEYWEGEPLYIKIKWLISPGIKVSSPNFSIPFVDDGTFTAESQNPPPGNDVYRIEISGKEVLLMQSAEIYKGKQYTSLSFRMKLLTNQTGLLDLSPVTLAFDRSEGTSVYSNRYSTKVIPSNPLQLSIKSLPSNAPSNVILSRGKLELVSSAAPLKAHIGDPITFNVVVKNALVPENTNFPSLQDFPQITKSFSIPNRRSSGKIDGEDITFSQTIRPTEIIKEIPSLEIPYFNVNTGLLEKTSTEKIPLEVLETQVVTSADLESTGYSKGQKDIELVKEEGGLYHNFPINKLLKSSGGNKEAILSSPVLLILFLPPVLFLIYYLLMKRIHNKPKNNTNFENLYLHLKDKSSKEIYYGITGFLQELLDKQEVNMTPREISQELEKRDYKKSLCENVQKELEALEKCLYSSEEKTSSDPLQHLNNFLKMSGDLI